MKSKIRQYFFRGDIKTPATKEKIDKMDKYSQECEKTTGRMEKILANHISDDG